MIEFTILPVELRPAEAEPDRDMQPIVHPSNPVLQMRLLYAHLSELVKLFVTEAKQNVRIT